MPREICFFLDESGDLGRKTGTKYFAIAILATECPVELRRCVKRVRQRKLKKRIRESAELKASHSPPVVREALLKQIASTEVDIYVIVVPKSRIVHTLYAVKDKLYNYLAGLLTQHLAGDYDRIMLIVDKRSTKEAFLKDFDQYVRRKLQNRFPSSQTIKIEHKYSEAVPELQTADFVAWAAFRKFERGESQYYDLIKSRVRNLITPFGLE